MPATQAMSSRLVEVGDQTRLQATKSTVSRLAMVAGGPLAGGLIAATGSLTTVAATAVLSGLAALALALTSPTPREAEGAAPPRTSLLTDAREGLRHALKHPYAFRLILGATLVEFGFAGPMNTGLPLLAREQDWGAGGMGILLGAFGLGAGTSAAILAIAPVVRAGRYLAALTPLMGIFIAGAGLAPTLPAAAACAVALGLASGVVGTLTSALVLAAAGDAHAARFMSLLAFGAVALSPVSYLAIGLLTEAIGARASYAIFGAWSLVFALALFLTPRLRRMRLPSVGQPSRETDTVRRP